MERTFSEHVMLDGGKQTGNIGLALVAGIVTAMIGSGIWMAITLLTGMHIGYVALGVGALVGMAIRFAGHGSNFIFGLMGAVLTLLSCLVGEIGATIQMATTAQYDFFAVLTRSDLVAMTTTIFSQMSPVMYVIYGIGIFEGYKLSIVKVEKR